MRRLLLLLLLVTIESARADCIAPDLSCLPQGDALADAFRAATSGTPCEVLGDDDDPQEQRSAIILFARAHRGMAVPLYDQLLRCAPGWAILALGEDETPAARARLRVELENRHRDWTARCDAAAALAKTAEGAEIIAAAWTSFEESRLRRCAAESLGRTAPAPAATVALQRLLRGESDPSVRQALEDALWWPEHPGRCRLLTDRRLSFFHHDCIYECANARVLQTRRYVLSCEREARP